MKVQKLLFILLALNILFIALMLSCKGRTCIRIPVIEDNSEVLAIVGNTAITRNDLDYFIRGFNIDAEEVDSENRKVFLQQLVFDRLLCMEGRSLDIKEDHNLKRHVRDGIFRVYSGMLLKYLESDLYGIDELSMAEFYEKNRDLFSYPAKVRIQLIYIKGDEENELIKQKEIIRESLARGTDFESLAKKYSSDPSAGDGGDTGWITCDSLDPRIAETALNELEIGQTSEFFDTVEGSAIIRLTDRKDAGFADFDRSKSLIRSEMIKSNKAFYTEQYYKNLEKLRTELTGKYTVKYLK